MVRHLYRDYLVFEDQYRGVREFWEDLVADVARRAGQENEWQPWRPKTYGDGITPIPFDLDSIWDARSEKLGRAIDITQGHPESPDVEIGAYLKKYDDPDAEYPTPMDELAIDLSLSEESAALARTLLEHWMDADVSYEQMESLIPELLPKPDED